MASPPPKPAEKSLLELAKEFLILPFDKIVIQSVPEVGHLAPVILTLGTAFFALLSLNTPLAVFSASSFEALLVYNVIKTISDFSITPALGSAPTSSKGQCSSAFQTLSPSRFSFLLDQGIKRQFPNQPLYFISFAAAYCIQSLLAFSEEASEQGPKLSNRPYLAIVAAALFIGLYAIYLVAFGCDSVSSVMITIAIGLIIGLMISFQNTFLFGKSSVNLMFIPPLVKRKGMDYVCVSSK
jgi:hypothetical protein